jgi:hypothetical protein
MVCSKRVTSRLCERFKAVTLQLQRAFRLRERHVQKIRALNREKAVSHEKAQKAQKKEALR